MDWDKRARENPDGPLTEQEAQDYLGHLIGQHNRHVAQPAGPSESCLVVFVFGVVLLCVIGIAFCVVYEVVYA